MPTRTLLHESTSASLKQDGNVWEAVILTPGQGSSGIYSEDMIAGYISEAFPVGTKHWFNHPDEENPKRDPRDQWGVSVQAAEHEPGVGGKTKIKILDHWKPVVEALAKEGQADLSVWVLGETDEDGNVIALYPDRQNSVDLVGYPGRPGSALTQKMYESARAAAPKPGTASVQEKEGNMDKEILEALNALKTSFDSFVTESKAAADAKAQAEADAKATDEAVKEALDTYDEKIAAIEAADLLEPQVEELRAAARAGEDIKSRIESAKKVVEAANKRLQETVSPGRTTGAGGSDLAMEVWS